MDLVATRNEPAYDVDPAALVEIEALDRRLGRQPALHRRLTVEGVVAGYLGISVDGVSVGAMPALATVISVAIGVIAAVVLWKVGVALLRAVSRPLPPPPPPGEMRRINVRYRCDVCGVELA